VLPLLPLVGYALYTLFTNKLVFFYLLFLYVHFMLCAGMIRSSPCAAEDPQRMESLRLQSGRLGIITSVPAMTFPATTCLHTGREWPRIRCWITRLTSRLSNFPPGVG
jgi:hypothetical protein